MSAGGLFRKEAVVAQRAGSLGTIRIQSPRSGWLCLAGGLLAIIALGALLWFGQYTQHQRIGGTLVPSEGLLIIVPPVAGVVTRVLVHDGDHVKAGQALVEISSEQSAANFGGVEAAIAAQLNLKRSRLADDLLVAQERFTKRSHVLGSQLSLIDRQIAQKVNEVEIQGKRAESAMSLYDQWTRLAKTGLVTGVQVLQQHDAALQIQAQATSLNGELLGLRAQREQLQAELSQLPATLSERKNDIERQQADLTSSMAQNAARRSTVLSSSVDGTVAAVLVHVGQSVPARQLSVSVLPAGSDLRAELWAPSSAIGFIRPGADVVLRYQAYPFQKFGQQMGKVIGMAGSAVDRGDAARLSGLDTDGPRYRFEVALSKQTITAYGHEEKLRAGMLLEADVILGKHRMLDWLVEPLLEMNDGGASYFPGNRSEIN